MDVRESDAVAANQQAGGCAASPSAGTQSWSPLRERLRSDCGNLEGQFVRSARALDILQRHPEFEELIELLGLIRVDIRCRPIGSVRAAVIE